MMKGLSRRTFLGGLGLGAGASLLSPLLGRLAQAGAPVPRRFIFVLEGNGFEPRSVLADEARSAIDGSLSQALGTKRWWYRDYEHDSPLVAATTDFASAPALGPIAALPAVAEQTAVLFGLSSKISGGGHSASHGVLAAARTIAGVPGGQTIDATLAALAAVQAETPFDAVRLGVAPNNAPLDFGACAFGKGRAAPMILQPVAAFDSLFGSVGSAGGMASFAKRRGLLDFANQDVTAALSTFSGSSPERQKLESYLSSLEELSRRHDRLVSMQAQLQANAPVSPETNPLYLSGTPLDRYAANAELVTAAFKGGLSNVAVLGSGTGGDFNLTYSSVTGTARHDLHHGSGGNQTFLQNIYEITRRQVAIIANMANELASTPEVTAEGSMLDHTAIVFIGDNGEQHHSTASDFPVVLMGGRAMGLQTGGRTIVYPGLSSAGHRQVSNLWNTLGHLAGADLNDFGAEGPSRRAMGPLSELMA